jgi:ring-1,2-phenylacetyl-CoA epoxidase subunit PaaD
MVEPVTGHGSRLTAEQVLALLHLVKDPEVPVLSVVELGVVRNVAVEDNGVTVTLTPTYSGCPAMQAIERGITEALQAAGVERVTLKTVYAPAWTTDWITEPAREKLRAYGIAPPAGLAAGPVALGRTERRVACPRCGSSNTVTISEFGATACKSLHHCQSCREPFEHFKEF